MIHSRKLKKFLPRRFIRPVSIALLFIFVLISVAAQELMEIKTLQGGEEKISLNKAQDADIAFTLFNFPNGDFVVALELRNETGNSVSLGTVTLTATGMPSETLNPAGAEIPAGALSSLSDGVYVLKAEIVSNPDIWAAQGVTLRTDDRIGIPEVTPLGALLAVFGVLGLILLSGNRKKDSAES